MKTITIPPQATESNALLEQARAEALLVRAADGTEFLLAPVEDFDHGAGDRGPVTVFPKLCFCGSYG